MVPSRTDCSTSTGHITPQLILGVLILFVGVIFSLDRFGIAPAINYLRFWPTVIIAIGVIKLLQAKEGGGAFVGLIFTVVGVWLQAEELGFINIRLWQVWPLGLVLFGAYLVWQGLSARNAPAPPPSPFDPAFNSTFDDEPLPSMPPPVTPQPPPSRPLNADAGTPVTDTNSTLSAVAILGGVSRGNNSRTFRGADLLAIMGGCQIDLRRAAINGDAVIDVFVMWGGIEIRVPEDWTVASTIVPIMAGVEDKTRPPQGATAHRLKLRGFALMGGVEIKN